MSGISKIKRYGQVAQVLYKYGFDELVDRLNANKTSFKLLHPFTKFRNDKVRECSVYKRIRLALEELGPTYIKLGQLLSNREDLLPKELIEELELLQDKVAIEPMDVKLMLAEQFLCDVEETFAFVEEEPFAAASISQVYKAAFKDGRKVVFKVRRSHIEAVIRADLSIMKDVSKMLESNYKLIKHMNLYQIVVTFGQSVLKEISFENEAQNILTFQHNFKGNSAIHVPLVYTEYSNDEMLCLEYIEGIKINDKEKLEQAGFDPKELVNKGLDLYLSQVLDFGFFHADPHPGNIFVNAQGQIVFIDFGSVGQLLPSDASLLENMIMNFVMKDPKGVIKNIKALAVSYSIESEKQLEREVEEIFTILNGKDLKDIRLEELYEKANVMLQNNHILLPNFIYLLLRGVSLIEGIGKQLNAALNIYESVNPYAEKIAMKRFSLSNVKSFTYKHLKNWYNILETVPENLATLMDRVQQDKLVINNKLEGFKDFRKLWTLSTNKLVLTFLIIGLSISSAIIISAQLQPLIWHIPLLSWFTMLLCTFLFLWLLRLLLKSND